MSTKTTASELLAFYRSNDPIFWPPDSYVDELSITTGEKTLDDPDDEALANLPSGEVVKIISGSIYYVDGSYHSFETRFHKWRREQSHVSIAVQLPKEKLEEITALLKEKGCSVL